MTDGRRTAVRVALAKVMIIAAIAVSVLVLGLLAHGYGACTGTPEYCRQNFSNYESR